MAFSTALAACSTFEFSSDIVFSWFAAGGRPAECAVQHNTSRGAVKHILCKATSYVQRRRFFRLSLSSCNSRRRAATSPSAAGAAGGGRDGSGGCGGALSHPPRGPLPRPLSRAAEGVRADTALPPPPASRRTPPA